MTSGEPVHWTHRLFVENGDLYLPFLEQAQDERAEREVEALVSMFDDLRVPAHGRVLDVACGIGRHSIPLAMRGYDVVGVDLSPLFVERARFEAVHADVAARFVVGDALGIAGLMADERPFDAVINMFTSHGYYGRRGDIQLFRQLRTLVTRRAALVVLTANRDWLVKNFVEIGVERAGRITIIQNRQLDLETSQIINRWEFFEEESEGLKLRLSLDLDDRVYSLHEMRDLLEETGWRYVRAYAGGRATDLGEVTVDVNAMWVTARA